MQTIALMKHSILTSPIIIIKIIYLLDPLGSVVLRSYIELVST